MLTACELCVCATYSAEIGTSLAATVNEVTAIGAAGAVIFSSLPHADTASAQVNAAMQDQVEGMRDGTRSGTLTMLESQMDAEGDAGR